MITLKIKNWFQKDPDYRETSDGRYYTVNDCESDYIEPHDEEKWKDGKTYEFNTLREIVNFCESCDIRFKDEIVKSFNQWSWCELCKEFHIDDSEDNLVIFEIMMYEAWRD